VNAPPEFVTETESRLTIAAQPRSLLFSKPIAFALLWAVAASGAVVGISPDIAAVLHIVVTFLAAASGACFVEAARFRHPPPGGPPEPPTIVREARRAVALESADDAADYRKAGKVVSVFVDDMPVGELRKIVVLHRPAAYKQSEQRTVYFDTTRAVVRAFSSDRGDTPAVVERLRAFGGSGLPLVEVDEPRPQSGPLGCLFVLFAMGVLMVAPVAGALLLLPPKHAGAPPPVPVAILRTSSIALAQVLVFVILRLLDAPTSRAMDEPKIRAVLEA
jgi:hypothetical protein